MLFVPELALAQYLRCIHIHLYRIWSPIHHLHRTPAALSGARHDDLLRRYTGRHGMVSRARVVVVVVRTYIRTTRCMHALRTQDPNHGR